MAFDWEAFEEESFWTRAFEKIRITLSPLKKVLSVKLRHVKSTLLTFDSATPLRKNINLTLRMKKSMEITLRRVE